MSHIILNQLRMFIANPIYGTVFKHLMQNDRVARFFIETIIDMPVESIAVAPREYTWFKPLLAFESKFVSSGFKAYEQKKEWVFSIHL